MNRFLLSCLISLIFSCNEQDLPADEIPSDIEFEERETLAEIHDVRALMDVEKIGESLDSGYVFMLELVDSSSPLFLHIKDDELICDFINREIMYGSNQTTSCAGWGYYYRYLRSGIKNGNYRMHVKIGGKIKEKFAADAFSGEPFILETITKIESCPVSFETNDINPKLENNFWQLEAFLDENRNILSYPTCEDPEIGIYFYDSLIQGNPIDIPEAKTFEILSEVWTVLSQIFKVYSIEEEGKIKISRALNPGYIPPRPATAQTNNFSNLTVDIKNKYDSLHLILRIGDDIEYSLNKNVLELHNPETQIRARFFKK